jgi:hypothetical protein
MIRIIAAALLLVFAGPMAMAADEPPHRILGRDGNIELRLYAPMILAEVEVTGSMRAAGNRGFRPLGNYIFGGNTARSGDGSDAIAMTTPVMQQATSDESWRVAFVMPPEWTMDTLPIPDDARVELVERPERLVAAIRFSGGANEARFMAKTEELRDYLTAQGFEIVSTAMYARYDPPWVPTPFRRNEVMFEVARAG